MTYLCKGVRPIGGFDALARSGFTFWERIIECLGFVPGGGNGPLRAGPPAIDIRPL